MTNSAAQETIAEGVWEADITRMYDIDEVNRFAKIGDDPMNHGIRIEFTIIEGEEKGKVASKFVKPWVTPRTILWGIWKAILKRELEAEDLAKIDDTEDLIENIGGNPVKLIIQNTTSAKGNIYYKLTGYMKSSRSEVEYPFLPGAPEGTQVSVQVPQQPVPNISDKEDMAKVAEEVFGKDAPDNPPVIKASGKKVV